jgi:hypothetical protein
MGEWGAVLGARSFWLAYQGWGSLDHDVQEALQRAPVLVLPFPQRYGLRLGLNPPYVSLALAHPSFREPIPLGWLGGNFALPALRWPEVALLERRLRDAWKLPFPFAYVPALLNRWATVVTASDDAARVSAKIWSDWDRLGLFTRGELAGYYKGRAGQSFPASPMSWYRHKRCGWVCVGDVSYSLRQPENADFPFAEVDRFFARLRRRKT